MKLSEAANRVIDLSRKIYDYYSAELPKRHPNYPLVGPDDEETPPPPEEAELSGFLATLPDDLIYQLVLLMDLGRGYARPDDLAGYYETLPDTVGDPGQAASHMMVFMATLADEIADGLAELRKHKINVDRLPLKKSKARKQ
jgi:hypothetical protein